MIEGYGEKILNELVDKYEKSKTFIGENKVNQKFSVKIASLFSKYTDHSNFEVFDGVNQAIDILVRKGYIISKANSANLYNNAFLNLDKLDEIYKYLDRIPKKDVNKSLLHLLGEYKDKNSILNKYCKMQYERIGLNKSIEYFSGDLIELENILKAVDESLKIDSETFIRDFSVKVFKDSKAFEKIKNNVVSLFYEYGDF